MTSKRPYPGLVKAKRAPLVERRVRNWIRCTDYRWREIFEKADVVSEGAVRRDSDGPAYYGTTNIRLLDILHDGPVAPSELVELHHLIRSDPHVRLRAVRLACLEAQVRSNSELSSVRTEISFTDDPEAVCISVDVAAKLSSDVVLGQRRLTGHRGRP